MNYQDALDKALALAEDRAALEAFLNSVPSWRTDLERALAVSRSLSSGLQDIAPGEAARQRSHRQLMATVSRFAAMQLETRERWLSRAWRVLTFPRFIAAAAVAGALLVSALVVDLPTQNGGGAKTAEAVVIEGSVAEVSAGAVTISTNNAARVVRLSSETILTDGFGNTVDASDLSAGQDVVLKGSPSGEEFVASQVELRDRLFGVVTALPGDSIHLSSPKGNFVILVTVQTHFEGLVVVGSSVEIKVFQSSDGTLTALEVEVEDNEDENHEGDADHGGAAASPVPPGPTSPSSNDPGSSGGGSVDDGGPSVEDDGGNDAHESKEDPGSGGEKEDD